MSPRQDRALGYRPWWSGVWGLSLWALTIGCTPKSECESGPLSLSCPAHHVVVLERDIYFSAPSSRPPSEGYPVVMLFQGAFVAAGTFWDAPRLAPRGMAHQVELTRELLEAGFLVLTPETLGEGLTAWNTNLPQWVDDWDSSPDALLMEAIFACLEEGLFGPVDLSRVHAGGISSGGYMTSRLAIRWPERLASVVVASGSYATCAGGLCDVPETLDPAHPTTLFLHGALDLIVPRATMEDYADALELAGVEVEKEIAWAGGHGWRSDAPRHIRKWVEQEQ